MKENVRFFDLFYLYSNRMNVILNEIFCGLGRVMCLIIVFILYIYRGYLYFDLISILMVVFLDFILLYYNLRERMEEMRVD